MEVDTQKMVVEVLDEKVMAVQFDIAVEETAVMGTSTTKMDSEDDTWIFLVFGMYSCTTTRENSGTRENISHITKDTQMIFTRDAAES